MAAIHNASVAAARRSRSPSAEEQQLHELAYQEFKLAGIVAKVLQESEEQTPERDYAQEEYRFRMEAGCWFEKTAEQVSLKEDFQFEENYASASKANEEAKRCLQVAVYYLCIAERRWEKRRSVQPRPRDLPL